jgi:hypothetical protein
MSALGQKQAFAPQKSDVRFAPNSDRESGFPQTVMSALPPKADDRERGPYVTGFSKPLSLIDWSVAVPPSNIFHSMRAGAKKCLNEFDSKTGAQFCTKLMVIIHPVISPR